MDPVRLTTLKCGCALLCRTADLRNSDMDENVLLTQGTVVRYVLNCSSGLVKLTKTNPAVNTYTYMIMATFGIRHTLNTEVEIDRTHPGGGCA